MSEQTQTHGAGMARVFGFTSLGRVFQAGSDPAAPPTIPPPSGPPVAPSRTSWEESTESLS